MPRRYTIVGANAGKTMTLGVDYNFEKGVMVHPVDESVAMANLDRILATFYSAFPDDLVPAAEKRYEAALAEAKTAKRAAVDPLDGKTLSELIRELPGGDDAAWNARGQPDANHLSKLFGKEVSRAEIEAAAPGYTRSGAPKAKQ